MVHNWEPGTQYNLGDVVKYEGHKYKIIQAHRSQSDWTPPVTPALWGRMSDGDHEEKHHEEKHHRDEGYHKEEHHQQQPIQQTQPAHNRHDDPKQDSNNDHKSEEQKEDKKWFGIDEDKLKIGGGLALGAAVLGGGLFAYKKHEEHKEERQNQGWAQQNWLEEAKARTAQFHQHGPSGPATWVLTQGQNIPQGAIVVGPEKSWTLYICRAYHEGGIQVGKASDVFKKGGVIGYKHEEIHVDTFEVLVGNMQGLRWVPASGRLNVAALGHRPVEGGREPNGTALYIAQAPYKGAVHPGKASEELDGAYIPYDGTEKNVKEYRVLCYNN